MPDSEHRKQELRTTVLAQDGKLNLSTLPSLTASDWRLWIEARLNEQDFVLEFDPDQCSNPSQLFQELQRSSQTSVQIVVQKAMEDILRDGIHELLANPVRISPFHTRLFGAASDLIPAPGVEIELIRRLIDAFLRQHAERTPSTENDILLGACQLLTAWRFRPTFGDNVWISIEKHEFDTRTSLIDVARLVSLLGHANRLSQWQDFLAYLDRWWRKDGFQTSIQYQINSFIDQMIADLGADRAAIEISQPVFEHLESTHPETAQEICAALMKHASTLNLPPLRMPSSHRRETAIKPIHLTHSTVATTTSEPPRPSPRQSRHTFGLSTR